MGRGQKQARVKWSGVSGRILQEISQPLCDYFWVMLTLCLPAPPWGVMHVQIRGTPWAQIIIEWNGTDLAWICSQPLNVADVKSLQAWVAHR